MLDDDPNLLGVAEISERDLSYEFNTFKVWRTPDGSHYYATDSGCSCPMPFEDETFEDLKPIKDIPALQRALDDWCTNLEADERLAFIQKVGRSMGIL